MTITFSSPGDGEAAPRRKRRLPTFLTTRAPAPEVTTSAHPLQQRSTVFLAAAALLDYPGENWPEVLDAVEEALSSLPEASAAPLASFISWARATGQRAVEETYVETFDQKRRCCLELTYYATGDTRQRGIALTIVRDMYAAVGWEPTGDHLPDYLPYVLELAAQCEGESYELVESMIASHREGVEILHASLNSLQSPWGNVVAAVRVVLPEVDDETFAKMNALIRQGPPNELVGLSEKMDLPWPVSLDESMPVSTSPSDDQEHPQ